MAVPGGGPGIQGSLDDLDSLPTLKVGLPVSDPDHWRDMRSGTGRNNALFRQLGREAHACDDFDALLDRARTLNDDFAEPMNDARVVSTVKSVWRMTVEGRKSNGAIWCMVPDLRREEPGA